MKKIKMLIYRALALNLLLNATWGNDNFQPPNNDFIKVDIKPIKFFYTLLDRNSDKFISCHKNSDGLVSAYALAQVQQYVRIIPIFNEEQCKFYNKIFEDQSKYFVGGYEFYQNKRLIRKDELTFSSTYVLQSIERSQCSTTKTKHFSWDFEDAGKENEYELIINLWVHKKLSNLIIDVDHAYGICGFNETYTVN